MKRIVIIDGNSLMNRAFYAMQAPMITKENIYTQGIYGFINMLHKIINDFAPEYMSVAFDRKSPTFRHLEYQEYKAGRKKMPEELAMQFPLLKEVLAAMNINTIEIDGFEADDIIGTIAREGEEQGLAPLIITGDKDALQLATDITKVFITRRGISDFDLYDKDKMIETYGLTPTQFIDMKGLMGDQSDNIPGLPGVGEKTAQKLLGQFGSIENMYENIEEIENIKLQTKVQDNKMLAIMSKRLATINVNVPIEINFEEMKFREPQYDNLIKLYIKLEFNRFLKALNNDIKDEKKEPAEAVTYEKHSISTKEELENIVFDNAISIKVFGDNNHKDTPIIWGVAFLTNNKYYYISEREIILCFTDIINTKGIKIIGHNTKNDLYQLSYFGLKEYNIYFDLTVARYLLEPTKNDYSIASLAMHYLQATIEDEDKFIKQSSQIDLLGESDKTFAEYGYSYLSTVVQLYKALSDDIKSENFTQLYNEVEIPLIEVMISLEIQGIKVDIEKLNEIGDELKKEILELETIIYDLAGKKFNINSPAQLGNILFEDLLLTPPKKSKSKYSTSAEVLAKIQDEHPIVTYILSYRTLSKLNSTYIEGIKPLIAKDNHIRAQFMQTVTATGRLSCVEPNLQNIPVKQEIGRTIRKAFVSSSEGDVLIGADYSQIELRILAHLSQDKTLINAFNNEEDIHRSTASRVLRVPYDKISSEERSRAKAINFGVIYGMSWYGLSEELKISKKQADQYIEDYFAKHKNVKTYLDEQIEFCKANGYVQTVLGRKRYIPELQSSNFMTKKLGERLAMNTPIQGSAADLIKIAMINVYRELKERNFASKLILQVHDELIINTKKEELEEVKELLERNMQNAMSLHVKLATDLNEGKTWYELK